MPYTIKGRSLLTLEEFNTYELDFLLDQAIFFKRLKRAGIFPHNLVNRNLCLIFLKPSTRTRISFVAAASDEGAHLEIFPKDDIRFGIKESVKDIARVLGRMFDGIAFRGFDHQTAVDLAAYAGVPVWNGLTDEHHPTQVLADLMTIKEEFGHIAGIKAAYIGDGRNNMVTSLIIGALKMGIDLTIVAPPELQPLPELVAKYVARREHPRAAIHVTDRVGDELAGCDVIYNDIWVSMGEEHLAKERIALLKPYKVTPEVMALTGKRETIYLHCMPALHDLETEFARAHPDAMEVSDEVFEGPHSRVFDQSENRMHTIKALMVETV